ncbi:MAG: FAD-binding oxidoreductase [Thermomicrobiales bacterium]
MSMLTLPVDTLRHTLTGGLITPEDAGYDDARAVWNGMIDRRPAVIARCATNDDVAVALQFALAQRLPIAVRGGGHGVAGHAVCDDGLVIDLSPMKQITVDVEARIARAGGGATWGELDAATQPFGLATPGGVFSRTGIAGLTLGGGYGWLRHTHGLACDNLLAAEVVTASGEVIVAEEDSPHAELLWALRGGGGNFGVVTSFTFQLHPVGPDLAFAVVFHDGAGEKMNAALRFFRDYCATAPDSINPIAVTGIIPHEGDAFPEAAKGRPFVMFGALHVGPIPEGEALLQPLREYAEPLADFSGVTPYLEVQQLWDADYPDGLRYYWKSLNLPALSDAVIDQMVAISQAQPSPLSTVDLWFVGGAMSRVPAEHAAFHGRHAAALLNLEANWSDPADDAANLAWVREALAAMAPYSDGSRYLNFAGFQEEGDTMMRGAFGPHYARLQAIKRRYDPENVFRLNQNIMVATAP